MPLLIGAILTATGTGLATYIIGRHKHRLSQHFAYKRVLENPRIKEGTRFQGIYTNDGATRLIPECELISFHYGEMVFRVTEKDHELEGTAISLTVMEFEKLNPFVMAGEQNLNVDETAT